MRDLLLVEDDLELQEFWVNRFRELGFRVHSADGLPSALAHFKQQPISVVVTDFHLQSGSGRRLLYEIRRTHSDLPVFLMTGTPYVSLEDFSHYGFKKVFLKPFPSQTLVDAVLEACPV